MKDSINFVLAEMMGESKINIDYALIERTEYNPSFDKVIEKIINDFGTAPAFHTNLENYSASPLLELPLLAEELGLGHFFIKDEAHRFGVPAIKMLGASFAVQSVLKNKPEIEEFCTATDGNHGRAVAWAARQASREARIFVPEYTVESRIHAIRAEGASVEIVPDDYDASVKKACEYAEKTGAKLVQDTAWAGYLEIPALITAGYYTQMYEIEQQTDTFAWVPDIIFVQSGVGSWPSAITHWVRRHPKLQSCKIVCVEPYNSDCFLESVKQGSRQTTKKSQNTIMAGLNCGTPSLLAWEIMKGGIDLFLVIDDSFAIDAMKKLYVPQGTDMQVKAGESGAAGLAGLLALLKSPELETLRKKWLIGRTTKVLVFNTEGISDPEFFAKNIL